MMIARLRVTVGVLFIVFAFMSAGCSVKSSDLKVGGLYSITDDGSEFQVAKILALDEAAVHVCIYKNKFRSRPKTVDPSTLSLEGTPGGDDFGIGHLPLSRQSFMNGRPAFIQQSSVAEDELEGYKMWKEAGGGVWP